MRANEGTCEFCGESPVVGTSTYDSGEVGPACALCCDAPSLREGETDLAFAERYADALETRGYKWGSDAETALFVAIKEVRRLRQSSEGHAHRCDVLVGQAEVAEAKLARVEAAAKTLDVAIRGWDLQQHDGTPIMPALWALRSALQDEP